MNDQVSPYELGKIVSSIESLSRDVIKLETKIDVYLKDTIARREFDELKDRHLNLREVVELLPSRREFDNLKSDVNNIGSLVARVNDTLNQNQWIPRILWTVIGAAVTAGIGLIFVL